MYTIIDIAFAIMILTVGIILIAYLIIGGTTINTNIVTGIKNCIYTQIGNNIIPTLIQEQNYEYVEKIIKSCGASEVIIKVIENNKESLVYPTTKTVESVLLNCGRITTIEIPLKNVIYLLIICIR